MKIQVALIAATAALFAAAPAAANEVRAEARGGVVWAGGFEEAVAGAAAGYDFDLDHVAFMGIEASADHVLADGFDFVYGVTGRVGAKIGDGKLYVTLGHSFGEGEDQVHAGGGYQHKVTSNVYVKAEYRRFFGSLADANVAVAGIGMTF